MADFNLQALVRPNIWALQAYHCARDDYTEGVLLDANENSFGPPVTPNELVFERYPCPYQQELKTALAGHRGVDWENVFVGVGSDEAQSVRLREGSLSAEALCTMDLGEELMSGEERSTPESGEVEAEEKISELRRRPGC